MGLKEVEVSFKNNPEKWYSFGEDKRTAHYKKTKRIREAGADFFYPKKLITEKGTDQRRFAGDGQSFFTFYHCRAIVHFKDGHFEEKKIRITTKQYETIKKKWGK